MSQPINVKFEVPRHKAPPPTKVSLWPALKPAPAGIIAPADGSKRSSSANPGDRSHAEKRSGPITTEDLMRFRAGGAAGHRAGHGRSTLLKLAIPAIPVFALITTLGLGCANEKPQPPTGVMDVAAAPAPAEPAPAPPAPAPRPPAPQKTVVAAKPVAAKPAPTAPSASVETAPTKPAATTYTVQKGDTLFGIAKSQYGDGNKWKKIADANPGLNANTLKVGAKIVVPQ